MIRASALAVLIACLTPVWLVFCLLVIGAGLLRRAALRMGRVIRVRPASPRSWGP